MNTKEMIAILDNAILGIPNTCISEHSKNLTMVRDALASAPPVVADAPRATPPPLDIFCVDITLSKEYLAENEDEAWERALNNITNRGGMDIVSHKIRKINPPPEEFL